MMATALAPRWRESSLTGASPLLLEGPSPGCVEAGPASPTTPEVRPGLSFVAQPIYHLRSGAVVQHELLLRVRRPGGRPVGPAAFIKAAEISGAMTEIDLWVVGEAVRLVGVARALGKSYPLAVNLSALSLLDCRVPRFVEEACAAWGASPRDFTFEVTETAPLTTPTRIRGTMAALRSLGCRLALDDFGAGYSSLERLVELPADYVKIDGRLVKGRRLNARRLLVVAAIATLARQLGMETIAESVDSLDKVPDLVECGVHLGQGFGLGRPLPVLTGLPSEGWTQRESI